MLAILASCSTLMDDKFFGKSPVLLLEGKGVSMTRTHVAATERLAMSKKIDVKYCIKDPNAVSAKSGALDLMVSKVQKAYKLDFVKDFRLYQSSEKGRTCYTLKGEGLKIVSQTSLPRASPETTSN